jgi:hypothetical protein
MTSRNRLHQKKLNDFAQFCSERGWKEEPFKGNFEVLRMRHLAHKQPLLVYQQLDAKEHLTTHGIADRMLNQYLKERTWTRSTKS